MPNLVASAPYLSMSCKGSIPVPRDFDILWPSFVRTVACIMTSLKGFWPINSYEEKTILATHRLMIPRSVERTCVGKYVFRSWVFSGNPNVAKGQRALENHVSRTSSLCFISQFLQIGHCAGFSIDTINSSFSWQNQAGIWCPHQSWREMHQSLTFSSQSK